MTQPGWIAISIDDAGCQVVGLAITRDEAERQMYEIFATMDLTSDGDERIEEDNGNLTITDRYNIWHGYIVPLALPVTS